MAGESGVEAEHLLAQPEAVGVAERESGVVDDHADVADVVVEPLELEKDHAERRGPPRNVGTGQPLERLAIGQRMGHGLVSRHTLGERRRPLEGQRLEELFRPLCTKPSRVSRLTIVSPSTVKRKWPGSMIPACTGPTVISKRPAPSTRRKGNGCPASAKSRRIATSRRWGK